jgi:tetratricopeptide (TPR) repeat protein
MTPSPPNSLPRPRRALLEALLTAHKTGRLDELMARPPRVGARQAQRRWLGTVLGTAGDAWPAERRLGAAAALLLRWGLVQLRPDRGSGLSGIDRSAWLDRTSWRPMLAVMCHYGFEPVPAFRDRYHARSDEAAADTLCGLWSVGPSTFYRYLDKGERLLAQALARPPRGAQATALRRFVGQALAAPDRADDADPQRSAWHRHQAERCSAEGDLACALWHCAAAGDATTFLQLLRRGHAALAIDPETDSLCALLADDARLTPRQRFDLHLAQARLWRARNSADAEQHEYEQALRIATAQGDALMLGIVYGALGKFHEPRDADRAFACYEDSAEFLRRAGPVDGRQASAEVTTEYAATLIRLAWLHVLRNDPRSRTVLDSAQQLRAQHDVADDVAAMLEQAWGEYWRRAGDLRRSLEHNHRALNRYERIGDERSMLAVYNNLSLIYGQLKEFDRSIDCARHVVRASARVSVEPEILASVHLNLGATFFWQARYDDAIGQYQQALAGSRAAGLTLHAWRSHYNLAEAFYKRYQATRDPEDERLGDAHSAAALAADQDAERAQATRTLKGEVLGTDASANRLLPQEVAAHFDEITEVQRQRAVLAIPIEPGAHVRAHLAIARAYLAVAAKEREAARALIQKHGLDAQFSAEFDALRSTFNRELSVEEQAAARWREQAADFLDDSRRASVLAELFRHGAISKSGYAQLCGVAPATASKHLGELALRGLLRQTGKGPSTRYRLPDEPPR